MAACLMTSTTVTFSKHNLSLTTINHHNTVVFKNTVRIRPMSIKLQMKVSASSAVVEGSKSSVVVGVDLGDRSYPIYIGSGLLNQPDLLQSDNDVTCIMV
ncbi:3-dehydroquinate synthase AroB [Artemisia annua]|uniref:3-dehydroquinate synthase AroB n=1 Tax=Artemisia annua TaxID=35608 RepID=A0A2U1LIE6_ARTAN|nr:3-dehydroquinate synthase AroB [Artemisia annua]